MQLGLDCEISFFLIEFILIGELGDEKDEKDFTIVDAFDIGSRL